MPKGNINQVHVLIATRLFRYDEGCLERHIIAVKERLATAERGLKRAQQNGVHTRASTRSALHGQMNENP